ncbi:hypothetical protein [Subtercola endophyticus]|uniref:hypothetical protein n=1 Tax=Subtercola endophyticus TaxID=2895559 RepID=UPI001E2AFA68|nr:hypothetical protein [Subtercola endophyticus]UFS57646.1 hypothetical protein LQ955_11300 [Subtercola endophyticus]
MRTVGRKGSITYHPKRAQIEAALASGLSYRNVSERFDVSVTALHRFSHGPLSTRLQFELQADPERDLSDLIARMFSIADNARYLAEVSAKNGDIALALRAGDSEMRILVRIMSQLGLDDSAIEESLKEAKHLGRAIVKLGRAHPRVAEEISKHLEEEGAYELASALRSVTAADTAR